MRTPSLPEIKAHLRQVGYTLVDCDEAEGSPRALVLHDKEGIERGSFSCPASLWQFWKEFAARILFDDICIRRFLVDFQKASGAKRQQMADAFVDHVNGGRGAIDRYLEPPIPISADQLPRRWKWMLERNLNGEIAALGFFSYVGHGMKRIDPTIEVRKSNLELRIQARCNARQA